VNDLTNILNNVLIGQITEGIYVGMPIEIHFGKPLKILLDGKDVTQWLVSLNIKLDSRIGQLVTLEFAELSYSQFPEPKAKR